MISTSSLRPGSIYEEDSRKYLVLKYSHIKKGRGQAVNRVKVKDLESGSITEKTYTNEQSVSQADVTKKSVQFLYKDGDSVFFMDQEDYSQFSIDAGDLEEEILYLKDGLKVIALLIDGKAVSIELPKTIEAEITYTEPAVSGNTSSGAMKDAELETGLKIKVPLFLKTGDYVKINTQSGEYISRV